MSVIRRVSAFAFMAGAVLAATSAAAGSAVDVQGHRGCRGLRPENTLPAFRHALELHVTTLELDLQVTSDRVLIVSHDQKPNAAVCRLDDGGKAPGASFKDLALADLADLDCGSTPNPGFPEQQASPGARIPSFDQLLQLAHDADYPVRISVEIKMQSAREGIPVDEFAKLTVDALGRHGMLDRTTVQSFDAGALRAVERLEPSLPRAILVRKRSAYDRALADSGATILSPKHTELHREDVGRMHERGIKVVPWTVNDPADIRRMLDWGVDGIISDYPDRVLAALAERVSKP